MRPLTHLPALLLAALCGAAEAQAESRSASRGALLYENHCGACHTEQMHWREKRRARDWNSLRELVRQWQGDARLDWGAADIDAVTRHLNEKIYRFPAPAEVAGHRPSGR